MNKKSASIFLGIVLDLVFSVFYIFVMSQWKSENEEITLHMNQVGIFKEQSNSQTCIDTIQSIGLHTYSYTKDDLIIVVTSLNVNEEDTLKEQTILSQNNVSYVLKNITSSSKEFVKAVNEKNYEKIMELMSN